jgi:hypothetical protein
VPRQRALGEFDVAGADIVDATRAAEIGRFRELPRNLLVDQRFDRMLDLIGELVAIGAEQLDTVILEHVVRGRDHDAEIGAHRARQHGDGGCRHGAEQEHVHADGGEAGNERIFDHVAGKPRVLADYDAMAVLAALEGEARGLADFQREFRGDHAIGAAADAVGPEILACHRSALAAARSLEGGRL